MERFVGLIGIFIIFLIVFLMSNNRKAINYKTVGMGFLLQIIFVCKVKPPKLTLFTSFDGFFCLT